MSYEGDYFRGQSVEIKFNTRNASNQLVTFAGSPAIAIYRSGNPNEITAGVSLTIDYDGRTGMHRLVIDTSSDATAYLAEFEYHAVVTSGTVDGVSMVGTVIASWSIENRSTKNLLQDVVRAMHPGGSVYFVTKQGDNAKDGRSWSNAKLTIASAMASAVNGDCIVIGPGVYAEQVSQTNLRVRLVGAGRDAGAGGGATVIAGNGATGPSFQVGQGSIIEDVKVTASTAESVATAITVNAGTIINRCHFTATSSGGAGRALNCGGQNIQVNDTVLIADQAASGSGDTILRGCQTSGSLTGCVLYDCTPSTANTGNITLGPIVGSRNPTNAVGSPITLEMFQDSYKSFALTVLDALGAAVDLSGRTLRFVVTEQSDPPVGKFDVEKPPITVSGAGNNIANVPVTPAQSVLLSAGFYDWRLWDVTTTNQEQPLLYGTLQILKGVRNVT